MSTVVISKVEYTRLKKIDRQFGDFLAYFDRVLEIRKARNEVKQGKVISQEKLFKKIGF
jgi:hypothetical protein